MKFLFMHESDIHRDNFEIPEELLRVKANSDNQKWRIDLKEGDMVDTIVNDEDYIKVYGWV